MKNLTRLFMIFILVLFLIGCSSSVKPVSFLPAKCMMGSGIACIDFSAHASGSLDIIMEDRMGVPISNVNLNIGGICEPKDVTISQNQKFTCKIPAGTQDSYFQSDIQLTFADENGLSKSAFIRMVVKRAIKEQEYQ